MDSSIQFTEADFQSLQGFKLTWRWTEEKYNLLPDEARDTIRPFTPQKAKELFSAAALVVKRTSPGLAITDGWFTSISEVDASGDAAPISQWLEQREVSGDPSVIVNWGPELAVLTCWSVFCRYWDDFCYPMGDDVDVWPLSHEWRLVYAHNEAFSFGVLSQLPQVAHPAI